MCVQISYWLIENGFTVLIAACDTFRAGAVEQLRTHQRRLNSLHPPEKHGGRHAVQLFEKGYGKDAAGIAMEAIAFGKNHVIIEKIKLYKNSFVNTSFLLSLQLVTRALMWC